MAWDESMFEKDGYRYTHFGARREPIPQGSLPTMWSRGNAGVYWVHLPNGSMEKCPGGLVEAQDRVYGRRQSRY